MDNKRKLLEFVKEQTGVQLKEDSLLIGFSRRAVPYKRSDFIFSVVLKLILYSELENCQLSSPAKPTRWMTEVKRLLRRLLRSQKSIQTQSFLENYDMTIGSMLVRGSDVWLNNPRRPQEASGTSGMKAAMNGALNLSILDGWWPEACNHGVNGWQIGEGYENKEEKLDAHDQKAMYKVLLNEVEYLWRYRPSGQYAAIKDSAKNLKKVRAMSPALAIGSVRAVGLRDR